MTGERWAGQRGVWRTLNVDAASSTPTTRQSCLATFTVAAICSSTQHATSRVYGASEDFCYETSRVLHDVVLEQFKPATDLLAHNFLGAVLQSMQYHHRAWTAGIRHKDVTLGNLMYSTGKNGEPLGSLVDWDVAPRADIRQVNRSGTIPFMALDFLRSSDKHVEHLYRHDLEALFWVLVWVCYPANTFVEWGSGTYAQCREKKHDFLGEEPDVLYSAGCEGLGIVVSDLTAWFKKINDERQVTRRLIIRNKVSGQPIPTIQESTPKQIWESFCQVLRDVLPALMQPELEDTARVLRVFLGCAEKY